MTLAASFALAQQEVDLRDKTIYTDAIATSVSIARATPYWDGWPAAAVVDLRWMHTIGTRYEAALRLDAGTGPQLGNVVGLGGLAGVHGNNGYSGPFAAGGVELSYTGWRHGDGFGAQWVSLTPRLEAGWRYVYHPGGIIGVAGFMERAIPVGALVPQPGRTGVYVTWARLREPPGGAPAHLSPRTRHLVVVGIVSGVAIGSVVGLGAAVAAAGPFVIMQ